MLNRLSIFEKMTGRVDVGTGMYSHVHPGDISIGALLDFRGAIQLYGGIIWPYNHIWRNGQRNVVGSHIAGVILGEFSQPNASI